MSFETLTSIISVVAGLGLTAIVQLTKKTQLLIGTDPRTILFVLVAIVIGVWVVATSSTMTFDQIIRQAEALAGAATLGHYAWQKVRPEGNGV